MHQRGRRHRWRLSPTHRQGGTNRFRGWRAEFRPDLGVENLSTWWVYLLGPVIGALIAVGVAYVLRGPAKAQEAIAAMGRPLEQET